METVPPLLQLMHDIRSPLTALRALARRRSFAEPEQRLLCDVVRTLEQMITDILKPGRDRESMDWTGLRDAYCQAAEEINVIYPEGVVYSATQWCDGRYRGRSSDVKRVVSNLLENSLRCGPPGNTVRLSLRGEAHHAVITCEDAAGGMEPRLAKKIFRPGVRGRKSKGSGYGLSIVKQICERNNWKLELDTRAGVGTVVRIVLNRSSGEGSTDLR
jgi:signal transduction histidine kinase